MEFDLLKEYMDLGEMEVRYLETGELAADMLTKSLPAHQFRKLRDIIMGGPDLQHHFGSGGEKSTLRLDRA